MNSPPRTEKTVLQNFKLVPSGAAGFADEALAHEHFQEGLVTDALAFGDLAGLREIGFRQADGDLHATNPLKTSYPKPDICVDPGERTLRESLDHHGVCRIGVSFAEQKTEVQIPRRSAPQYDGRGTWSEKQVLRYAQDDTFGSG